MCAIAVMYRPLQLSSVSIEIAQARGIRTYMLDMLFLVTVALAATMSVPVVGAGAFLVGRAWAAWRQARVLLPAGAVDL